MEPIAQILILIFGTMALMTLLVAIYDYASQIPPISYVRKMNREIVKYDESGWVVLIDIRHRVVGLYKDQLAVSHAKIRISRSALNIVRSGRYRFSLRDLRLLDVEIPRFSYRVLYEYQVPHETPVYCIDIPDSLKAKGRE